MSQSFGSSGLDKLPEIEMKLAKFGLRGLQAEIFLVLLQSGSIPAATLANKLNVGRTDIYRVLKLLARKGLIQTRLGNPNRYEAAEPNSAAQILATEMEESVRSAKTQAPEILTLLESIAQRTSEEVNDNGGTSSSTYFRLLSGRSVVKTWRDLLERSESQVVRVWSPQGIEMSYSNGFVDDFKKAVERGVRIRGVVEMTLHNSSACSAFSSVIDLRYIRSLKDSLRYELVDDTNIAISLVDFKERKGQLEAISTNNRVIVRGFKSHFEHLWSQAIPHQFESNK